jgi:hypothetical protein
MASRKRTAPDYSRRGFDFLGRHVTLHVGLQAAEVAQFIKFFHRNVADLPSRQSRIVAPNFLDSACLANPESVVKVARTRRGDA